MGSLSLLQRIFPTQGGNPGLRLVWDFFKIEEEEEEEEGVK